MLKECNQTAPFKPKIDVVSKAKSLTFAPRSISFEINEKPNEVRRKQDPLSYIPIVNPRSILPLIESNWKKDEIGLPAIQQEEKQAVRLIVIRRKKMKKHQRHKLWKRMRYRWARVSSYLLLHLNTFTCGRTPLVVFIWVGLSLIVYLFDFTLM